MSQTTTGSTTGMNVSIESSRADRDMLARFAIFRDLPEDVLSRLADHATIMDVPAQHILCAQGERARSLFLLIDGQVTLSNSERSGISAVVEVVPPGGHFILTAVLARMPYLMSAHSTTPARVIAVDADALLAAIQEEPMLASAILRAEAMDFGAMVRQVCDLKLRTTAQRLGCYLLELTDDAQSNSASFRLPFDKRLLAAKLGCRQENLSRAFAALRNLGVETHGARVILHDVAKLRDYAQVGGPEEASDTV